MPLTFSVGTPCAGGNHVDITATLGTRSIVVPVTLAEITEPMERADADELVRLMIRLLVSTTADKRPAVIKQRLEALTVTVEM